MIRKILFALCALAWAQSAIAQPTGNLQPGQILGNPLATAAPARGMLPSALGITPDIRLACDGVTDNVTTINAAVAALPATGGIIQLLPNGVLGCGISSMVTIGNGVGNLATNISTANSTRNGIVLRGISNGTASAETIPQQGALVLKWLGASSVFISGAANNGAGLIRLTVSSTAAYTTGAQLAVNGIVGTLEANGPWTVTVVDATHFDLQGSTFTNAYVSGGTIGPIMVKVAGPTSGIELSGIVLDCNLSCSTGLLSVSATTSRFDNLLVRSYYGSAYIFTAYASGVNLAQGMLHSPLTNVRSSGPVAGSGATGITIGASTMGAGLLDVSEITITDSLFTFDGTVAGSSGILLQFADAITFIGAATVEQGAQVANTYGLRIVPPTGVGGSSFPAAVAFLNPILYGNVNNPGAGWTPTQGIGFYGYPKPGGAISLPVGTTPSQFWGNTLDGQSFGWVSLIIGSDIRDSAARQFSIGNTTGDSVGYFGQSTTRGLFFGWNYNATAGSAFASISTNGNSNPLAINASSVNIQGASGLPTVVGGSFTLSPLGAGIAHVSSAGLVTSSALVATDISLTNTHFIVGNGSNVGADVAMSGDATLANTGAVTLATVASAGTTGSSTAIPVITINAKGLTTSITTAAVVAPAGTLTGATLAANVLASSLTSVGTLSALTVSGTSTLGVVNASGNLTVAKANAVINVNETGGGVNLGYFGFQRSGADKWLFGIQSTFTTDGLVLFDSVGSVYAMHVNTGSATTGNINIDYTTDATSTSTGALRNPGGMSVNKRVFMNGLSADTASTDVTVCNDTTSRELKTGTGALGVCLGTSGWQFKTAFTPMTAGISELMKIKLQNYRYLPNYGDGGKRLQYGVTAQDVEAVLPDLAGHDVDGNTINYDWPSLLFIGLRASQQLKHDSDNFEARLQALEERAR